MNSRMGGQSGAARKVARDVEFMAVDFDWDAMIGGSKPEAVVRSELPPRLGIDEQDTGLWDEVLIARGETAIEKQRYGRAAVERRQRNQIERGQQQIHREEHRQGKPDSPPQPRVSHHDEVIEAD